MEEMKMQFVFDEKKLKANNITVDEKLCTLRNYFKEHKIKETSTGVFEGEDSDFGYFALCVADLPKAKWFMDYIKEWYWFLDGGYEDVFKGINS